MIWILAELGVRRSSSVECVPFCGACLSPSLVYSDLLGDFRGVGGELVGFSLQNQV